MSSTTFDPRLTTYFGDGLLQAGFMPLPHLFLRHYRKLGISHLQALFTLQLMEIAWDLGEPPVTMARIADRLGVSIRAVRDASKALQDQSLIVVYDQFDDTGAQVENGYDLSPLFERLTAFAPAAGPGPQHVRRARSTPAPVAVVPDTSRTPPRQPTSPSPRQPTSPLPGSHPAPPPEAPCPSPRQAPSGLKEEQKNLEEQQKNLSAAVNTDAVRVDATELMSRSAVLSRCGLNPNVVEAVIPTLPAAAGWALWSYARGAQLGSAWIAKQLFDPSTGRPRPIPDLPSYAVAGECLATLPTADAARLLDLVNTCCPDHSTALLADDWLAPALATPQGDKLRAALEALWSAMAQQRADRGRHQRSRTGQRALSTQLVLDVDTDVDPSPSVWTEVRDQLEQELPTEEWSTWLRPLALLDLTDDVAVVGAPNVFVRDMVLARYHDSLAAQLAERLGRVVQLDVVIDSPVA